MANKIGGLNKGRGLESLIPSARSSASGGTGQVRPRLKTAAEKSREAEAAAEKQKAAAASGEAAEKELKQNVASEEPAENELKPNAAGGEPAENELKSNAEDGEAAVKKQKAALAGEEAAKKNAAEPNEEAADKNLKEKSAGKAAAEKKTKAAAAGKAAADKKPEAAAAGEEAAAAGEEAPTAGAEEAKKPLAEDIKQAPAADAGQISLPISAVYPNARQPRRDFPEDGLSRLAESIKEHGVIQPLIVRPEGKYYEIIAGERRWRAAKLAGLKEISVIVREYNAQETLEVSIIENIQREDLKPLDEANAYKRLIDEFGLTQEEIAKKVSKSRAAVANSLRLLNLEESAGAMLNDGIISPGHARALLAIEDPKGQAEAAKKIAAKGLSVRDTERLVKKMKALPRVQTETDNSAQVDEAYELLEEQLKTSLGTKVAIKRKNSKAGIIEIEFYSVAELERLAELLRSVKEE